MKRWKLFLPLAFFLAFSVLLYVALFMENKTELPSALLNKPLPEFRMQALDNPEKTITRYDVIGQVVLINVWGSWCPACKIEHPHLVQLHKQGVPIIGLNYKDERPEALKWLNRYQDPYLFTIQDPDGKLGFDLGVYGAPETFIVDHTGVIRYRHVGILDARAWDKEIEPLYDELRQEAQQ